MCLAVGAPVRETALNWCAALSGELAIFRMSVRPLHIGVILKSVGESPRYLSVDRDASEETLGVGNQYGPPLS